MLEVVEHDGLIAVYEKSWRFTALALIQEFEFAAQLSF